MASKHLAPARATLKSESGVGLVSVMLALSLLAVFALVAASLAVNERRTAFNEMVHASSFIAADSGGETAIAWLMIQDRPPAVQDMANGRVNNSFDLTMDMGSHQQYDFDLRMRMDPNTGLPMVPRPRFGYDANVFRDFFYDVDARGEAGVDGESNVSVIVTKLTQVNYN